MCIFLTKSSHGRRDDLINIHIREGLQHGMSLEIEVIEARVRRGAQEGAAEDGDPAAGEIKIRSAKGRCGGWYQGHR